MFTLQSRRYSSYIIRFLQLEAKILRFKNSITGRYSFCRDTIRVNRQNESVAASYGNKSCYYESRWWSGGWESAGRGWSQVNTAICITRPGPWLGFVTSAGKLRKRSLAASLIIVEFITRAPATRARLDSVQISTLPPDVVTLSTLNS